MESSQHNMVSPGPLCHTHTHTTIKTPLKEKYDMGNEVTDEVDAKWQSAVCECGYVCVCVRVCTD